MIFPELQRALVALQQPHDDLLDAAIAVATELRRKVREGRRAVSRRRREQRELLRAGGHSNKEIRARLGSRRKSSGVSIEARSTGDSVVLTGSDQVQHFRRIQGETVDIVDVFRRHMSVAERWRKARGL